MSATFQSHVPSFSDPLEARVEVDEQAPAITAAARRGFQERSFLQVRRAHSLPELVGQGDDELLQRRRHLLPTRVRQAHSRERRRDRGREEHPLACGFVLAAWPRELSRVLDLAGVMEHHANPDKVLVNRNAVLAEEEDEQIGCFPDELDVSQQVRRSAQGSEQRPGIIA
ncbi:hypothetical protein WMF29_22035 [Sorangium sp. So ce381]